MALTRAALYREAADAGTVIFSRVVERTAYRRTGNDDRGLRPIPGRPGEQSPGSMLVTHRSCGLTPSGAMASPHFRHCTSTPETARSVGLVRPGFLRFPGVRDPDPDVSGPTEVKPEAEGQEHHTDHGR